jgi:hypothetical protein
MLEGTPVTRKLKTILRPIREKSILPLSHHGKPAMDILVAELTADMIETLRPHAGLYELTSAETSEVLGKVAASLQDIAKIVEKG